MKKKLILLITCLSSLLSFAQENDALYIYRNDGLFNAFFYSDIDSMTVDTDSSDEFLNQIIWTQDSVYRIPLEAIDSISFCKPVNKYASGVRKIDDLLPYIVSVEGMTLHLASTTPSVLIPHNGDVILYESFEDKKLPMGFAGKVSGVENLKVICDSVCFEDVYDKYICFGEYAIIEKEKDNGNLSREFIPHKIGGTLSTSIDISGSINADSTSTTGYFVQLNGRLSLDLKILYKYDKNSPAYFELSISPKAELGIESGVRGEFTKKIVAEKFNIGIPIPDTPFFLGLTGGPTVDLSVNASVTARTEGELSSKLGLRYENEKVSKICTDTSKDFSMPEINGNINGSLFAGVHIDFGIYSYGGILSAVIEQESGAEFVGNLSADMLNFDKYDVLKNAEIALNQKASYGGKLGLKLWNWVNITNRLTLGSVNLNINSWKIVPSFSAPAIEWNESTEIITSVVPDEKLIWPLSIGLGIWRKDGEHVATQYCPEKYRVANEWPLEKYMATFANLLPQTDYIIYPMVDLHGIELKASPATNFRTETIPVKIIDFEVKNGQYYQEGFTYKNQKYKYNFECATTVKIESLENVEDWGYVYKDLNNDTVHVSVKDMGSNPCTDTRYAYYRNDPKSTATLYGYVKYYNDDEYYHGEAENYDLMYDWTPNISIDIAGEENITTTEAQFEYSFSNPMNGKGYIAIQAEGDANHEAYTISETVKDTLTISDLQPATTYTYWAYVEHDGKTYMNSDGKKTFTTLTPTAYVKKADEEKITTTSAQVVYGFSNVPQNAKCYIHIGARVVEVDENTGEEIHSSFSQSYSVSDTVKSIYEFTDLRPNTTYTYFAYIDLDGEWWVSNEEKFTTKALPAPVATTGDCSNITKNSAEISCTFENVPEYGICGVEYTWDGGTIKQAASRLDGTQTISLNGLKPGTTYTYCAYIEANGQTYYGEEKAFTTEIELPDLSGTWDCTIFNDDGSVLQKTTLKLTSDNKATQTESSFTPKDIVGNWKIDADRHAIVNFSWDGGSWSHPVYYGELFSGTVNSLSSPSSIEGKVVREWYGISDHRYSYKFIMTR